MRRYAAILALVLLASSLNGAGVTRAAAPPRQISPHGQINVMTVNGKQNRVLGIKRFLAMFELGRAIRFRPVAFNGGFNEAVTPPDVLILQEFRPSNLEIFERLLKQRFDLKYRVVGPSDAAATLIANTDTVTPTGEAVRWADVCTDPNNPPDGRAVRDYQFMRFTETATGLPFVVAAMHLAKNYAMTGQSSCLERNIDELRRQLVNETAPTIVGGDFNKRAVQQVHECDHEEISPPLPWWTRMTDPFDNGRVFVDAILEWHRVHGRSLSEEWTHEQKATSTICDGTTRVRRTRIDYLFSTGAVVAEAHTDHPGWAGEIPGTRNRGVYKYSDHRFVWGRFILSGPPAPPAPTATQRKDGVIALEWQPVEGAVEYVVLRALGDKPYGELQRLQATGTTFLDTFTEDGRGYRYSIAAIGSDGAQGLESNQRTQTADASGPHVIGVLPLQGAHDVQTWRTIQIRVDEGIDPASVSQTSIELFLGDRRVGGRVRLKSSRRLAFNPNFPLKKGKDYRVVVHGIKDRLGNRAERYGWHFFTEEPPPKKHRRRR